MQDLAALISRVHATGAELRTEVDRRFTWLTGIVVTSFVATIGTVAGAFWTILQTAR